MKGKDQNRTGKSSFPAAVYPALLFWMVYEIAEALLVLGRNALAERGVRAAILFSGADADAVITTLSYGIAALPVLSVIKGETEIFAGGKITREGGKSRTGAVSVLLLSGVPMLSLGINLFLSILSVSELAGSAAETAGSVSLPAGIVIYGFFTPLVEELVFRGGTYARMRRLFPEREDASRLKRCLPALMFSSLLFALWHQNLPQGIYAFVMGAVFALSYEIFRTAVTPVLLHAECNLLTLFLAASSLYNSLCTPVWAFAFTAAGVIFLLFAFRAVFS